jgi:hypothetical protein
MGILSTDLNPKVKNEKTGAGAAPKASGKVTEETNRANSNNRDNMDFGDVVVVLHRSRSRPD